MIGQISMSEKNTAKYILTHYAMGKRDFSQLQLRKINLQQAKLQGINLQGSDLRDADLSGADLNSANLSNCYLNEANLMNANLMNANLTGAHLTKANCQKAIFQKACFTNSFLIKANLFKADLTGAILNGAYLNGAIFQEASYNNSTRFDKGLDLVKLGLVKQITLAELISDFENIVNITISYLGEKMTFKNFEQSRPDIEWLQKFSLDKPGQISYQGSLISQASLIKLKSLEKWISSFIKQSSLIIHDLPSIIEQKKFQ